MLAGSGIGRGAVWFALAAACSSPGPAVDPPPRLADGISVSLYRTPDGRDHALIDDRRALYLDPGDQPVQINGVIETARLVSIDAPGTVWRNARIASPIAPALGHEVFAVTESDVIRGALVQVTPDHVMIARANVEDSEPTDRQAGAVHVLPRSSVLALRTARSSASIQARVSAPRAGRYPVRFVYTAHGLSWRAEYTLDLTPVSPAASELRYALRMTPTIRLDNLTRWREDWVSISLHTELSEPAIWRGLMGLDSGETRLNEMGLDPAGERPTSARVEYRFRGPPKLQADRGERAETWTGSVRPGGGNNPWSPEFGSQSQTTVARDLVFTAGSVLPAGRATIRFQRDGNTDALVAAITETARPGEQVRISLGIAERLTGQRRQLLVQRRGLTLRERYEIRLINRGDTPAPIRVIEPLLRPGTTVVLDADPKPIRAARDELEFELVARPGKRNVITYTVDYRF